jgi:pimeloyl-ACP methyl ester carboxylesterase
MGCEAPICVDANARPAHLGDDRETVVLLHGSASNSALWRHIKGALQSRYRCVAPDLIGYGSSAAWPQQAAFGLDAELRAIEPSLRCCADTLHLVGHSYGGVFGVASRARRSGTGPVPHVD